MIATFQFLKKQQDPTWTFKIATILIPYKHDLIQKATGWMLREVGNKCGQEVLEVFLKEHYRSMGRTALRYALEKFPMDLRARYMKKS
jgi:3-methyladenine DNA glycosylase AlkD